MTPTARGAIGRKVVSLVVLVVVDLLALLAAFGLAYLLRAKVFPSVFDPAHVLPPFGKYLESDFLPCAAILVGVFFLEKLYSRRMPFWEELRRLFRGLLLTFVLLTVLIFIGHNYSLYSRAAILLSGLLGLTLVPLARIGVKKLLGKLRLWTKTVLILGTGPGARRTAQSLMADPMLGYELVGFLADKGRRTGEEIVPGGRVLGPLSRLERVCRAASVQDVVVALPGLDQDGLRRIVERCEPLTESIKVVPDFGTFLLARAEADTWGDILSLSIPRNLAKPWNMFLKRLTENALAAALLVGLSPLFALIGLAVKIDSPGPVFYRQERHGWKGRVFSMVKFRSMYVHNHALLDDTLRKNPAARKDWNRFKKIRANDPRVTRVGRFLRRYSLDELPQLFNVLRGEMNLIGPRPYLDDEKKRMGRCGPVIFQVRPGLTGLWQVRGRSDLDFAQRLAWDEYYIRNWSLWLDVTIFFRTLRIIARGDGAY
jgi:Undecaprenyl-phosphate galactose phosphotransferase WbaP